MTLIEAMLVTLIIGVGVVAMLQLLATGTVANADSHAIIQAVHLAGNVREMTCGVAFCDQEQPTHWGPEQGESYQTFDDVDDLDGFDSAAAGGPLDGRGRVLADLAHWSQRVEVETVDPDNLAAVVADGTQPMARVTVTVSLRDKVVHRARWLVGTIGN